MGFSYPDWQGPFYPRSLRSPDWLSYYTRYFDTVELDTTFYAAPTADRVARWTDATPDDFRFCLKTPRAITHDNPLSVGVKPMTEFVEVCRGFGPKLGVVLVQFAPTFDASEFSAVDQFLGTLPRDLRFAVEFRHRSWGTAETLQMVHRHGCTFVSAEYLSRPRRVFATADYLYIRWIGVHDRYPTHNREVDDVSASLAWWQQAIAQALPKVRTVWGFFNNDYAGYSVATANRFKRLIGLQANEPVPEPEEPMLFG